MSPGALNIGKCLFTSLEDEGFVHWSRNGQKGYVGIGS